MKKILKGLRVFVIIVLALTLFLCVSAAGSERGFLPDFLPVAAYEADSQSYSSVLPLGSLALAEKGGSWEKGDLVIFEREGKAAFAAVGETGASTVSLYEGEKELNIKPSQVIGRVFYYIEGLGRAASFVKGHASAVWAFCGIAMVAAAVALLTAPGRRRKKEVDRLIKLFEFYGDKYDKEDEGVYY